MNSMNIIEMKLSPLYLLGILNSKLLSFWFIHKFGKMQRGLFPQFKINELEIFPIVTTTANNEANLIALVERKIYGDSDADKKIDELVYKLYEMSDEEIKFIEKNI